MARIDYFMTDTETSRLVEELISRFGARFTPQQHGSSNFPSLTSLDDMIAYEREGHFRTRFFVTSAQWGIHPFRIEEFRDTKYHHFWLQLRHGGPFFDHCPSSFYADSKIEWIVPGMFSDFPSYYSDGADIPRPPEMAKAFSQIRRLILKDSVRSRCGERDFLGPHISPGALEFFKAGGWLRIGDWRLRPVRKGD
jgi:hypothetical protein